MLPQCENASVRSISREADFAWLAGIIDGEGNVTFYIKKAKNGKFYFAPKIRIANTDVRMIQKIAEIYTRERWVFFYTINKRKRYNSNWKDQLHIEVASQRTARKVLEAVLPYLVNKRGAAEILLEMIVFVQSMPKGGNTKAVNYIAHKIFQDLLERWHQEKDFHVEPSTTTRRAGTICAWH